MPLPDLVMHSGHGGDRQGALERVAEIRNEKHRAGDTGIVHFLDQLIAEMILMLRFEQRLHLPRSLRVRDMGRALHDHRSGDAGHEVAGNESHRGYVRVSVDDLQNAPSVMGLTPAVGLFPSTSCRRRLMASTVKPAVFSVLRSPR